MNQSRTKNVISAFTSFSGKNRSQSYYSWDVFLFIYFGSFNFPIFDSCFDKGVKKSEVKESAFLDFILGNGVLSAFI